MLFQSLYESSIRGELILVDGGICHWHLRKDGQITIREIIVLPEKQGSGIGSKILESLRRISGAKSIVARCPSELSANCWYEKKGFHQIGKQTTKSGKTVYIWRLSLIQ